MDSCSTLSVQALSERYLDHFLKLHWMNFGGEEIDFSSFEAWV